jgi:catechol 2,3-dioxygenase-like lactoylglutathione lyase family enzyme
VTVDLFAGLPVSDYQRALTWYGRLLGSRPAFFPNATEAVWELAEHRYLYIEELPERAGHALHTVFVDDLDERVESIGAPGNRARLAGDVRERCAQGDLPRPRWQRDRLRRRPLE